MIWEAHLKNGEVIREHQGREYTDINVSDIDKFSIMENGSDAMVKFNTDTGKFEFPNIDLRKVKEIKGDYKLELYYDEQTQNFTFTPESRKLYKRLALKNQKDYFFISFDKKGRFNINKQMFNVGFKGEEEVEFLSNGIDEVIHYREGASDFYMRGNKAVKKTDLLLGHTIGLKKTAWYRDVKFELEYRIKVNYEKRFVGAKVIVTANKDLIGKLFTVYGNKKDYVVCRLNAHQPTLVERRLTLI